MAITPEEAIRILAPSSEWRMLKLFGNDTRLIEARQIAVEAIKNQQIQKNGCDKCTIDWDFNDTDIWDNGRLGEIRISEGEIFCNIGKTWHITEIRFCPFCGRKLTGEY